MEIYSLFAHTPNLIVQETTENDEELAELRHKCRYIVTHFKQRIKARDKLSTKANGWRRENFSKRCDNHMDLNVLHV